MFILSSALLYDDFTRFKKWISVARLFGVSSNPYHQGRALFRNARAYGLNRSNLMNWACEADCFPDFIMRVRDHILNYTRKKVWAEKTPRNIRVIGKFIEMFPNARVIHIVRDPRDVIVSLMGRGKTVPQAIETWLASVSAIQPYAQSPTVLQVRYEDICRNPMEGLDSVFNFLGVPSEKQHFFSDATRSHRLGQMKEHKSWGLSPDQQCSTQSVGRYRNVDLPWEQLMAYRLTTAYARLIRTRPYTVGEMARQYGYDAPVCPGSDYKELELAWKLDPLRRLVDRRMGIPPYIPIVEAPVAT